MEGKCKWNFKIKNCDLKLKVNFSFYTTFFKKYVEMKIFIFDWEIIWSQLINTQEVRVRIPSEALFFFQSAELQDTCKDHDFISFSIRNSKYIYVYVCIYIYIYTYIYVYIYFIVKENEPQFSKIHCFFFGRTSKNVLGLT